MESKESEDRILLTTSMVSSNNSSARSCRLENGSFEALRVQEGEQSIITSSTTNIVVKNTPPGSSQSLLRSTEGEERTTSGDQETPKTCTLSCQHCGKKFTKSWALKVHLRIHTGTRPHICDLCGKAFTQSGDLQRHIRVHTGEKPFKCEFCSRGFSRMITRRHHQVVCKDRPKDLKMFNSRMLTCYLCDITFSRSCDLQKHLRGHKPPFSTSQIHRSSVNWNQKRLNSYQGKRIDGLHVVASEEPKIERIGRLEIPDYSNDSQYLDKTGGNDCVGEEEGNKEHEVVVSEKEPSLVDACNVMEVVSDLQTVGSVVSDFPSSPDIIIMTDVNDSVIGINASPVNDEATSYDRLRKSSDNPETPANLDNCADWKFPAMKKAKCHVCGRVFRTMSTLDKHLHLHEILQRRTNRGQNTRARDIEDRLYTDDRGQDTRARDIDLDTRASMLEDKRSTHSSDVPHSYENGGVGRQNQHGDTTPSMEVDGSSSVKRRNNSIERLHDSRKEQVFSSGSKEKWSPISRETNSANRREIQTGVINPVLPYTQRFYSPSNNTVCARVNDDPGIQTTAASRGVAYLPTSNNQQRPMFSEMELVLKIRLANVDDKDFIEVELDEDALTFDNLIETCCRELALDRSQVVKIRKLPNTIVRRDKDVMRLNPYQELEVVFD